MSLILETRPCRECKCSKRVSYGYMICTKKLMGVLPNMLVTFDVTKGTCFEPDRAVEQVTGL